MGRKVKSIVSPGRKRASARSFYEVLKVHPRADAPMIESAYWHLARKYQAEIEARPEAAAQLKELNEAYTVLATPTLRRDYDKSADTPQADERVVERSEPKPAPARARKKDKPKRAAKSRKKARKEPSSIGIRWEMPPLQAVAAAIGLLVLGTMAMRYGAPILTTLLLEVVALFCVLFPWRFGGMMELPPPTPKKGGEEPQVDATALRESTAAMIARWRREAGLEPEPASQPRSPEPADTKASEDPPETTQ